MADDDPEVEVDGRDDAGLEGEVAELERLHGLQVQQEAIQGGDGLGGVSHFGGKNYHPFSRRSK